MAVLTENALRSQFFKKELNESIIKLPKGTILTPSARSFLNEKKINIEFVEENEKTTDEKQYSLNKAQSKKKNATLNDCQKDSDSTQAKSEYKTFLDENTIVSKDHKRIIFRGKLESLQSKIMEGQLILVANSKLVEDLSNILDFVRMIFESEVTEEPIGEFELLGMNEMEIQKLAHHPKQYFGIDHFQPNYHMGKEMVVLNALRTTVREIEISAYQTFKKEDGRMNREDLLVALNRLSSLCSVMMLRCKTGYYLLEEEG